MTARHVPFGCAAITAITALCSPLAAFGVPLYGDAERLGEAITRYEAAADRPPLASGAVLKRGDEGPRVEAVAQRLAALGDLDEDDVGAKFDDTLDASVRAFQRRSGLKVDGVVGRGTRRALNAGFATALKHMRASRARMLELSLEGDYVLVNVPDFRLVYVRDGEAVESMKVIAGRPSWDTPGMSDVIEQIVVNPQWNVPVEIVAKEIAPGVVRDPKYLEKKNLVVLRGSWASDDVVDPDSIDWDDVTEKNFEYFVAQRAGPTNPLGRLKILFPNSDDIYLHDTPNPELFSKKTRGLSHGCIRMERPFELAAHLVEGTPDWDGARLEAAKTDGRTEKVTLAKKTPVHIVYWTAWVDDEGKLQLRNDLYDRDAKTVAAR